MSEPQLQPHILESIWEGNTAPKLGDELRGARYTKGVSIEEAARDLRLKSDYIDAIEHHNLDAFPSRAFISGYVRSYAKYLGLDAEHTLKRFNAENNIQQQKIHTVQTDTGNTYTYDSDYASGYFGARNIDAGALVRFSLTFILVTLVLFGIGYIVKVLFLTPGEAFVEQTFVNDDRNDQSVIGGSDTGDGAQRIMYDVANVRNAQGDVADSSSPTYDELIQSSISKPDGAVRADGPISAIKIAPVQQSSLNPVEKNIRKALEPVAQAQAPTDTDINTGATMLETAAVMPLKFSDVQFIALQDSWLKIRSTKETVFQGLLKPGTTYQLPEALNSQTDLESLFVTTGNAGGIYVRTPQATYGPLGRNGQVLSGLKVDLKTLDTLAPVAKVMDSQLIQQ